MYSYNDQHRFGHSSRRVCCVLESDSSHCPRFVCLSGFILFFIFLFFFFLFASRTIVYPGYVLNMLLIMQSVLDFFWLLHREWLRIIGFILKKNFLKLARVTITIPHHHHSHPTPPHPHRPNPTPLLSLPFSLPPAQTCVCNNLEIVL